MSVIDEFFYRWRSWSGLNYMEHLNVIAEVVRTSILINCVENRLPPHRTVMAKGQLIAGIE